MLNIFDSAIVQPLSILLINGINQIIIPDIWKKLNICQIHKRGEKQIIDNCRPVSLLPICRKLFEILFSRRNQTTISLAQGLIFKPKSVGASNSLLSLVENFLSNRFQRVLLNDQTSQ